MAFFKKFLKPKWQHENPEIRRQALADLDSTEQLLTFLQQESDSELRILAVKRITDPDTLESLCSHQQSDVKEAAQAQRLDQLLPPGTSLQNISDSGILVRIAGLTKDQALRLEAIGYLTDETERLSIARTHAVAKVRFAAADGITQAELLQQLQDHAQGKDKAVYRLCKERLASYRAEQDARTALNQKIEHLIQQANQLNRLGYGPDFNGRLQVLNKQFTELENNMSREQSDSLSTELAAAANLLKEHDDEEQRLAESKAKAEQAHSQQHQILQQLSAVLASATETSPEALQQQLQALDTQWRDSQIDGKADADSLKAYENQHQQALNILACMTQYEQHKDALEQWLASNLPSDMKGLSTAVKASKDWQKRLKWPADREQPDWAAAITAKQQRASEQLSHLQEQQQSYINTIDKQIKTLEELLQNGHLKEASKLYSQANSSLRRVDSRAVQNQQRQIKSLGAQLGEMRDWQGFVTTPKKEALCEAMEALAEADISPDVLADKIQVLQDEWKTLNSSQPDRELWQRFQAAGDKAFEPCRAYFASVAEKRQQNVDLRNQLINELVHYESAFDWEKADWKVVQQTLDAARDTFRQYSPVDRAAHKDTQQRFHDVCDHIYSHLKAEFERNLETKRQLVKHAEEQIEVEHLPDAIDVIKALQQDWKTVGITPRNADQKLWKQFRTHCDAVFARLDQERADRRARIDGVVQEAEALLTDAEALLQSDLDSGEAHQRLTAIEQALAQHELPKSVHQRIRKGLIRVGDSLLNRQQQQQQEAEQAKWTGLLDRLKALAINDETLWHAAPMLPDHYQQAAFDTAWETRHAEEAASPLALDICIQMEILAGMPSQAADQARRMELQVQRLSQGLGQVQDMDKERQLLIQQWLETAVPSPHAERFYRAVQSSISQ